MMLLSKNRFIQNQITFELESRRDEIFVVNDLQINPNPEGVILKLQSEK